MTRGFCFGLLLVALDGSHELSPASRGLFSFEVRMSVEAELIWLRIMAQIRREDAIVDRMRAST